MKDEIKHILRQALKKNGVSNQKQLVEHLKTKGHELSQSTISRLLREIEAMKLKNNQGQLVYCLAKEPPPPNKSHTVAEILLDISHNQQLIIIHTSPGGAQLIARIIDYHREQMNILGTIAGDDTVFIAVKEDSDIKHMVAHIKELLLRNTSPS